MPRFPAVLWAERCSMTLPLWPQTGSLMWRSGGWEATFKCWWWKNHCPFSPWTSSVILCSCIIFAMPRSLLWNNMLPGRACFQTSFLLKAWSPEAGEEDNETFAAWVGQHTMKNLLSSKVGEHCHHHHHPSSSSQPATGQPPAGEVWRVGNPWNTTRRRGGVFRFGSHCNVVDFNFTCKHVNLYFCKRI